MWLAFPLQHYTVTHITQLDHLCLLTPAEKQSSSKYFETPPTTQTLAMKMIAYWKPVAVISTSPVHHIGISFMRLKISASERSARSHRRRRQQLWTKTSLRNLAVVSIPPAQHATANNIRLTQARDNGDGWGRTSADKSTQNAGRQLRLGFCLNSPPFALLSL